MVPREGFDTPEQHLKNIEMAEDFIQILSRRFGFVPSIETKTLTAMGYIKGRQKDRARKVLNEVDPANAEGFNLYTKAMKYLAKVRILLLLFEAHSLD